MHKIPYLPRNLHLVSTPRSPDNGVIKNTQHDTSEVVRLPRKLQINFWKRRESIAPATQNGGNLQNWSLLQNLL